MVEPHGVNVDLMSVGVGHLKAQRWCAMNTHVADLGKRVLQLPDVSGYEVARELRRRAGKRPLHIAAVSGMSTPDVRARAHAAGFDQHLAKPTDAAKLRHVLYIADLRARST